MMKMLCSAVAFGLGPTGKLCSIVNACKQIDWYLCGDEIDEFVFKRDVFKDRLFSRKKSDIKNYIDKYNIKNALVILDGELANLYVKLGLTVIYVDSLPFMWQESDVINGDVPLDVDYYCAQINYGKPNSEILKKAKNLVDVGPILPVTKFKRINNKYDVIVNLGGLCIDGSVSTNYLDSIIPSIIKYVNNNNYKCLITCGMSAGDYIKKNYIIKNSIVIDNLEHEKFLNTIYSNDKIITTAGLTTILEISKMDKSIILLPPNNLSQYYNQEIAAKILKKYKIINWKTKDLAFSSLKKSLCYGEEFVVDEIQKKIQKYVGKYNFINELSGDDYEYNMQTLNINNGTLQVKKIIDNLSSNEVNLNSIDRYLKTKTYINKEYFYVPYIGKENFSQNLTKLKNARDYMINDILKIDDLKQSNASDYNLGHGNPMLCKTDRKIIKKVNKIFSTNLLSKYNSSLGSYKTDLLDFINNLGIYYDDVSSVTVDNIIPTNSVTHAFFLILKAICRKHDVVLFTAPCYGLFAYMPERVGAETRFIDLRPEDNYVINPNYLKNKIIEINKELKNKYFDLSYTPRVVAFVNENPHNPVGNVLSKENLNIIKELNKVCFEEGTFIIDDLVYQGTEYDKNNRALPCAIFPKYFSNVISCFGTSKAFNLPGLRLGFILANKNIVCEIRNQIFYTMDSYSLLNEIVLSSIFNRNTFISKKQCKLLDKNINLYQTNYALIKDFVNSDDNLVKFVPGINPTSGFFAILDFSLYKNKNYKNYTINSERDLLCFLYEYGNIRFVTGESMAWPNTNQLIGRITYSINTNELKGILEILADTLKLLR